MGEMEMRLPDGYTYVFTDIDRDVSTDLRCDSCNANKPRLGGYSVVVRGNAGTIRNIDQLAVWICESCHIANSR